jgi:hypothetical protein
LELKGIHHCVLFYFKARNICSDKAFILRANPGEFQVKKIKRRRRKFVLNEFVAQRSVTTSEVSDQCIDHASARHSGAWSELTGEHFLVL